MHLIFRFLKSKGFKTPIIDNSQLESDLLHDASDWIHIVYPCEINQSVQAISLNMNPAVLNY